MDRAAGGAAGGAVGVAAMCQHGQGANDQLCPLRLQNLTVDRVDKADLAGIRVRLSGEPLAADQLEQTASKNAAHLP